MLGRDTDYLHADARDDFIDLAPILAVSFRDGLTPRAGLELDEDFPGHEIGIRW